MLGRFRGELLKLKSTDDLCVRLVKRGESRWEVKFSFGP